MRESLLFKHFDNKQRKYLYVTGGFEPVQKSSPRLLPSGIPSDRLNGFDGIEAVRHGAVWGDKALPRYAGKQSESLFPEEFGENIFDEIVPARV